MDESLASLYKTFRRYRDDILEDEDIREKNMAQTEIVYCVTWKNTFMQNFIDNLRLG